MKLDSVQIEGFRGVNQPLSIDFHDKLTILSGENGSGKTSIFQAIEWCLFGRVDLSGIEFQKEDAIVNDFHPKGEAKVILTLDDGTQVVRTRSKKGSTRFGKRDSKVEVIYGEDQLKDEEAQDFINEKLGLTVNELGVAVHLRQETIRDFIQKQPTQRSETIDKMIGLINLRQLIAGIDLKSVDNEITTLEKEVADTDRNMIQATLIAREMLAKKENQLIQDGASKDELGFDGAIKIITDIDALLQDLAGKTGQSASIPLPSDLESCQLSLSQAKTLAAELQEARVKRNQLIMASISRYETLQSNLKRSKEDLETLAGMDPEALKGQRNEAIKERDAALRELTNKNSELASLRRLRTKLGTTERLIANETTNLQELGTIAEMEAAIENITKQMEVVEAARKTAKALSQLLPIASDYLEKARPTQCPVCQQVLKVKELNAALQTLRLQVDDDPAAKQVEILRQEYQSLNKTKQGHEQRVKDIKETQRRLERLNKDLDEARAELLELLGEVPTDSLLDFIDGRILATEEETKALEAKVSELTISVSAIEGQLRSLKAKLEALDQARAEIIRELKLPADSEELNEAIQEEISQLNQELSDLQSISPIFIDLNKLTNRVDDVIRILVDQDTLSKLEKDYPIAVKQKEALERAIGELRELKLALQDIYQAATEHQRSLVEGSLKKLLPEINQRFSKILGHPVYTELQIIPEEEKKGVYRYWIGARDPDSMRSTYVATRFSTAQRNAAALAIFLAMAELLPHNLNVLMIDEPTQSMDPKRQEAIAKFLAEESDKNQLIIGTEMPEFANVLNGYLNNASVITLEPWSKDGTCAGRV